MKKILFIVLLSAVFFEKSNAQIDVPVNLQTGAPIINIPIYEIRNGDVSVPVSLYYTPGVKIAEPHGKDEYNLGVGWALNAGGKISRSVKSLPDDYQGTGTDARTGWLYGTGAASVSNFTPQSRVDCSGDAANYGILNSFANNKTDTEPDVFNFNFGGYSGQFMFDNNKVIQTLPYQDLKIQPSYSVDGAIASFMITANNGVQYTFTPTTTITITNTPADAVNNVLYLKDKLIKYGQVISYTTVWSLDLIKSPSGSSIFLGYYEQTSVNSNANNLPSTDIYLAGNYNTTDGIYKKKLFYTNATTTVKKLSIITEQAAPYPGTNPGYESISFIYQNSSLRSFKVTATNAIAKTISLNAADAKGYTFLTSVQTQSDACTISPPYEFEYLGTTIDGSGGWTLLPFSQDYDCCLITNPLDYCQQDYWGYYNDNHAATLVPNLHMYPDEPLQERYRLQQIPGYSGTYNYLSSGADRSVNPNAVTIGSLSRIIYPTGGSVKFDYESNQYFDSRANQTFLGGGIRVKKVTLHDGINTTNDIIKTYTYSGGVLLNRPQFAFSIPVYTEYNGTVHTINEYSDQATQARFFTARTENDLNPYDFDSADIFYQSGTESQAGKGKMVYAYTNPATFGQITSPEYSAPNQWQATYSQYATTTNPSSGACMSKGLMADGYYSFPYPTNSNYGFERGLLQSIKAYNETGQLVKETNYQYTPIYQNTSPVSIYGLTLDYFNYSNDVNTKAFVYGKYKLLAAMNKYQAVTIEKTYDPTTNYTAFATVQTDLFYNSPNHTLLSSTQTSTSNDGINFTTYKTKYKYPQDYTATATTDPVTEGILALKNSYMNSIVVEKINSLTKPGQSEQVTGAQLIKYKIFSIAKPVFPMQPATFLTPVLPSQTLVLKTNAPLGNFTESTINSNQFQYDARYQVTNNISEYSTSSSPVSMDDGHQNVTATLYDISGVKPIASINNGFANQVLYSNFDDDFPVMTKLHSFDAPYNGSYTTVPGRIGSGLSVAPNFSFTKSAINKGRGDYYIFSCWIKNPTSNTGTITVTLSDGSHTSGGTINYTGTTGVWSYYRLRIPVTNLNPSFGVNVQNGSLQVILDDMLLRPELAPVALTGYQNKLKIADTDPHGNTTFYAYDALGRPTIVTDQNQNILKRLIYSYRSSYKLNANFTYGSSTNPPATVNVNAIVNFFLNYVVDPCEPSGIVRTWDFGDNTPLYVGINPSHVYASPGLYTVTLTVYSPLYGTVTATRPITVVTQLDFALHATGIVGYNVCTQEVLGYGDLGPGASVGTNTFSTTVNGSYTNQFLWEMAYDSAPNAWTTVPGNSNTVTVTVAGGVYGPVHSSKSYTLRCTMLPQSLQKAAIKTVKITYIAPCP